MTCALPTQPYSDARYVVYCITAVLILAAQNIDDEETKDREQSGRPPQVYPIASL